MIHTALVFLKSELALYVQTRSRATPAGVHLGNVVDQDGKVVPDRLILTMVNIEEETIGKRPFAYRADPPSAVCADAYATHHPPLSLNLYLLVTASVETNDSENTANRPYETALSLLSTALEFFQANPHFNRANAPSLDAGIEKLLVDLVSLTLQEQQNLWSYLGAKYMPSALFRVRLVTIAADQPEELTPAIKRTESHLQGSGQ